MSDLDDRVRAAVHSHFDRSNPITEHLQASGVETIPCPACEGKGCKWCFDAGLLPTGRAMRKQEETMHSAIRDRRRIIANIDEVLRVTSELEGDMLDQALASLDSPSREELQRRADEDRESSLAEIAVFERALLGIERFKERNREMRAEMVAREAAPAPPVPAPVPAPRDEPKCSARKCKRAVAAYDDLDRGWCKRHAHARGLLTVVNHDPTPAPTPAPEARETPSHGPVRSFPLIGGPLAGTRRDIQSGEVAIWLPHGGKEYRYDHHGSKYVHTGAVREAQPPDA
jgi:hypothetical protein